MKRAVSGQIVLPDQNGYFHPELLFIQPQAMGPEAKERAELKVAALEDWLMFITSKVCVHFNI